MKKTIVFLLLVGCCIPAFCQREIRQLCASDGKSVDMEEYYLASTLENLMANRDPYAGIEWLPVQLHFLVENNGTGGPVMSELQWDLDTLNARFGRGNIRFYQCGPINYIRNSSLCDSGINSTTAHGCGVNTPEYQLGANNKPNAINIYFVPKSNTSHAHFPSDRADGCADWIIINNDQLQWYGVLAHELGHYLNLFHTFQGAYSTAFREHKERNSAQACYNCLTRGDLLCDTPADPDTTNGSAWSHPACNFLLNVKDTGCSLVAYAPDPENIMSYSTECSHHFTSGQFTRMFAAINGSRSYLQCNELSDCQPNYSLAGTVTSQVKYWQAANTISSVQNISSSPYLVYDAQSVVSLTPGFRVVPSGTNVFAAIIDGCFGSTVYNLRQKANQADTSAPSITIVRGKFPGLSSLFTNLPVQHKYVLTVTENDRIINKLTFRNFNKSEPVNFYHHPKGGQIVLISDESGKIIFRQKLEL